jgi:hypothetical protein
MFVITVEGKESEGAYSVKNDEGEQVLYIFEEEDDAVRYAIMLEEDGYPEMHVIEVEDDAIIKTCEIYGYQYTLITPNDIVIPPNTEEEDDYF